MILSKNPPVGCLAAAFLSIMILSSDTAGGWQADPEVVRRQTERRPDFNFEEAKVPEYTLPEILQTVDGRPITTKEEWMANRADLFDLFAEHIYGHTPGRPERLTFRVTEDNPRALDGAATLRVVEIRSFQEDREHAFELLLFLPNQTGGPTPVFLLLNNRDRSNTDPTREEISEFWPVEDAIGRNYGIAAIQNRELAPDSATEYRNGVIRLFEGETEERADNAFGALAAWGWVASRVMDYFETLDEVDHRRVAVLGHSRGGKASLWTGARDERFALAISNESGCGGAALSRRRFAETVARINGNFPHWFCENFNRVNDREEDLPVDQHQLMALMAPRAVYAASADLDLWADPRGEYLSIAHASPVFELWGYAGLAPDAMPGIHQPRRGGRQGYHIREGGHNLLRYDWHRYMDMGDQIWGRK